MDTEHGVLGYWEPQHGDDGTTGVGVIISANVNSMKVRNDQYLAMFEIPNNETFTYYVGRFGIKRELLQPKSNGSIF